MAGFRLHRRRKIISLPCKALTRSLYRLSHDQWLVFVPPSIFTLGSQPRRQLLQDAQNETSAGGAPAPAPGVKPELPCPCEAGPPGSEAGSGVSSGGHGAPLSPRYHFLLHPLLSGMGVAGSSGSPGVEVALLAKAKSLPTRVQGQARTTRKSGCEGRVDRVYGKHSAQRILKRCLARLNRHTLSSF